MSLSNPRPKSAIKQLGRLLSPYRWQVAFLSVLIAINAAMGQVAPQFVRIVIDVLIPRAEVRLFVLLALGMLGFYLLREMLNFLSMYLSFSFTQNVIDRLRQRTYRHLLELPLSRFTGERTGAMVSKVVSDVNALESMIQAGASRILGQLISIIVVLVILFVMNGLLALLSLFVVVLMAFVTAAFQEPLRRLARRIRATVGEMTAVATEALSNISVVKSFVAEPLEFRRFGADSETYRRLNLIRRRHLGLMQGSIGLSSALGTGSLLLVGGYLIATQPGGERVAPWMALSTGELTAFLLYLNNLLGPVRFVLNFNNLLQSGVAALERIDQLLSEGTEQGGTIEEIPPGPINFSDVWFTYPGAELPTLRGLNLEIPAGYTAALVGPSGAGKSTVVKLLAKLYDLDDGVIRLGELPLEQFALRSLRTAIAVVPQEPMLFSGSVSENILYARPEAPGRDVRRAAYLANAAEFIETLPQGFDTEIGERGVKLSGGQKQRIAIARAMLKGASVLVLDEATSSLDSESEAVIQDALQGHFAEHAELTSLIIAHRLSTVRNADALFVLDEGQVVEVGTHAELVKRGGLYSRLNALQVNESTPNISA